MVVQRERLPAPPRRGSHMRRALPPTLFQLLLCLLAPELLLLRIIRRGTARQQFFPVVQNDTLPKIEV